MKQLIFFCMMVLSASAAEKYTLLGQWKAVTHTTERGTKTTEKEYLKFYPDHTLDILFLVTLQKGNAFLKDLRIEGRGIWKRRGNILVVVLKNVEVPVAGEVYGISGTSLKQIAETFHHRFQNDPIRILVVKQLGRHLLVTENTYRQQVTYRR